MPMLSLRKLLLLDAGTCFVMGVGLAVAAGPVARITALPDGFVLAVGLILLPVALFMITAALTQSLRRLGAWLVVTGNLVWTAASAILLLTDWVQPNAVGVAVILVQALAVLGLAWFEFRAMRDNISVAQAL